MAKQTKKPTGAKVGIKGGKFKTTYSPGTPLNKVINVPSDAAGSHLNLAVMKARDDMNKHRWANFHGKMINFPEEKGVPQFEYTPAMMAELGKRGFTKEYIESYQPSNYEEEVGVDDIPEFGLGGWLKENKEGIFGGLKGLAGGALMGLTGGLFGGGLLAGGVGDIIGEIRDGNSADQQAAMLSGQQTAIQEPVDPTVNPGGMVNVANQYAPTFPMGGQVQTKLVELEKGEPFRSPDGKIGVVKDDAKLSHTNGGAVMPMEVGTQILGKKKDPDTKKTFKEMGKKLALQKKKYDKILDSKGGTYSMNAAKAMNAKIDKQFTNLFQKQEALKAPKAQDQQSPQQYPLGGIAGIAANLTNIGQNIASQPSQGGDGFFSNLWVGVKDSWNSGGAVNQLAQLAPVGYNLAQGLQPAEHLNASDYYNPEYGNAMNQYAKGADLMANRRFDVNPLLDANRNAQAIGDYNARTQGGLSAGSVASNRLANMAQRMRGDQSAYATQQNMNNQYAGQQANYLSQYGNFAAGLGQQQATTDFNVANINQQSDAARRQMLGAGFTGISDFAQRQQLMQGQQSADQQRMAALEGLYPMFNQWFPGATK